MIQNLKKLIFSFTCFLMLFFFLPPVAQASISDFFNPGASLSMADISLVGENPLDMSGKHIAAAGDVDGDGLGDLLIAAPYNDEAGISAGKVYLILGSTLLTGITDLSSADYMFTGEFAGDRAGSTLSSAGDVDGDGLSDILIAADSNDEAGSRAGKVYLILGSSLVRGTQSLATADYAFTGVSSGAGLLGKSIGCAGDIDGDGLSDFFITDSRDLLSYRQIPNAFIILGKSLVRGTSSITVADYQITDTNSFQSTYATNAGDVDGDGLNDLLLSIYSNDSSGGIISTIYIFLGKNLTLGNIDISAADFIYTQENTGDQPGYAFNQIASAGDVDGDGLDDLLIGASNNDDTGNNAGKVYLILASSLSSTTKSLATADYIFTGENASDLAGRSVSALGDINADGKSDILIGASGNSDGGGIYSGKTYIILSSSLTPGTTALTNADYIFLGEGSYGYSGEFAINAGDIDGNGTNDVFISAYNYPGNYPTPDYGLGKSYIILGNEMCTVHADAGPDQDVGEGELVTLDGTGSYTSCSSGSITYSWTLSYGPTTTLSDTSAVSPTFTSGVDGDVYVFTLTIETDEHMIDTDSMVVTVSNNSAPVANNVNITTHASILTVFPDATDPDGDSFTQYYYRLSSKPRISTAGIYPSNYTSSASTTINMDMIGTYVISYKVFDGREWSNTATITITREKILDFPHDY